MPRAEGGRPGPAVSPGSDVIRDFDGHDGDFDGDQDDDDPLERVRLVRGENLEEELGVLLDEVELELDLPEAVLDLELVAQALPDVLVLELLPGGLGALEDADLGDDVREEGVVEGDEAEEALLLNDREDAGPLESSRSLCAKAKGWRR